MQLEQIQGEVITSSLAFTKIRVDSQKIAKLKSSAAKSAHACRQKEDFLKKSCKKHYGKNHGSVVALLPDF